MIRQELTSTLCMPRYRRLRHITVHQVMHTNRPTPNEYWYLRRRIGDIKLTVISIPTKDQ